MLKSIMKLNGVKELNKSQLKATNGGGRPRCFTDEQCFRLTGDPTVRCVYIPHLNIRACMVP